MPGSGACPWRRSPPGSPPTQRPPPALPAVPEPVSIILAVPAGGLPRRELVDALTATAWPDLEWLLATDLDAGRSTSLAERLARVPGWQAQVAAGPTLEAGIQLAIERARGAYLVFLPAGTLPAEPDWLARLIAGARDAGAWAASPRLIDLKPGEPGGPAAGLAAVRLAARGVAFRPGSGPAGSRAAGCRRRSVQRRGAPDSRARGAGRRRPARPARLARPASGDRHRAGARGRAGPARARGRRSGRVCRWLCPLVERRTRGARRGSNSPADWPELHGRWGPRLHRQVWREAMDRPDAWATRLLRVAIVGGDGRAPAARRGARRRAAVSWLARRAARRERERRPGCRDPARPGGRAGRLAACCRPRRLGGRWPRGLAGGARIRRPRPRRRDRRAPGCPRRSAAGSSPGSRIRQQSTRRSRAGSRRRALPSTSVRPTGPRRRAGVTPRSREPSPVGSSASASRRTSSSMPSGTTRSPCAPTSRSTSSAPAICPSGPRRSTCSGSSATRTRCGPNAAPPMTWCSWPRSRSPSISANRSRVPVIALHQATDPELFHPEAGDPGPRAAVRGQLAQPAPARPRRARRDGPRPRGLRQQLAAGAARSALRARRLDPQRGGPPGLRRGGDRPQRPLAGHARRGLHLEPDLRRPGQRRLRAERPGPRPRRRVRRRCRDVDRPGRPAGLDRALPRRAGAASDR